MSERLLALRWLAYSELCNFSENLNDEQRFKLMEEFFQLANSPTRAMIILMKKQFFQLSEIEREAIDQSALKFRMLSST